MTLQGDTALKSRCSCADVVAYQKHGAWPREAEGEAASIESSSYELRGWAVAAASSVNEHPLAPREAVDSDAQPELQARAAKQAADMEVGAEDIRL